MNAREARRPTTAVSAETIIEVTADPGVRRIRAARYAAGWSFFVSGLVLSTWFVRLPTLQQSRGLSNGMIGLVACAVSAGGIVGMQFAARLITRFGSGPLLRTVTVLVPALIVPPALATSPWVILICLFCYGIGVGLLDVSMNTHGTAVERLATVPVMNGLHGLYSIGSIVAAAGAGIASHAGWSIGTQFTVMAVFLCPASALMASNLLPGAVDLRKEPAEPGIRPSRRATGWSPAAVQFGILVACCLLAEGAMVNWSAVFMSERRHTSAAEATLAYLAFSVMSAMGRVLGDRLVRRVGTAALIRTGAITGAVGLAVGLSFDHATVTIVAFGCCGAGLSVLVPTIFSAVGREGRKADESGATVSTMMSRVSTLGYLGVLGGPVIIGAVAKGAGLTTALALPAVAILLVGTRARRIQCAGRASGADSRPENLTVRQAENQRRAT